MPDTLNDEAAIQRVKHQYCYATDWLDTDRMLDSFTPDATLDVPIREPMLGHDEIAAYLEWLDDQDHGTRAHCAFNPVIDVDGDEATGLWYYIVLYTLPDGDLVFGQGRFDDEFERTDEGWKLSSVTATRRITRRLPAERME